jgi:3-keto-disaccharide hydrolase
MNKSQPGAALLALLFAAAGLGADQRAASAGWRALLEDHSAPEWRGWKEPGLPAGWRVDGGVLHKDGPVDDLVTNGEYGNFELELEWKIGKAGNSGIFYRGTREYDHIYWSAPEYQLLDDANAEDGKSPLTAAGSDYALYGVPPGVAKPFDQWNRTRLVVRGSHVEHWLNGIKVVEYELGSADWKQRVAASKFSRYPGYGLAARGLVGIQGDHPGALAVRHIRIRELP